MYSVFWWYLEIMTGLTDPFEEGHRLSVNLLF